VNLKKITGYTFLIAAAAGFIFGILGLIELWVIRPEITQTVSDNLALFNSALNSTQDGLTIVDKMVQTTALDVTSLQVTTQALSQTIRDSNPMLDSLSKLAGKDLPAAITATQVSLASAQNSALLIDNVLTTLTSIPFLFTTPYKPVVPLNTALAQVSDSLNSLTPALATINASLTTGKTNMNIVEGEITKISETAQGLSSALSSAGNVVKQYQSVAIQLKSQVEAAQRAAPTLISTIAWILTFLLLWFLIAQLNLCLQGFEWLKNSRYIP
jgi:hypothetical protein